jgi:hypothetical protein
MSAAPRVSASAAAATQDDDNDSSFYMVENVLKDLYVDGEVPTDRAIGREYYFWNEHV